MTFGGLRGSKLLFFIKHHLETKYSKLEMSKIIDKAMLNHCQQTENKFPLKH